MAQMYPDHLDEHTQSQAERTLYSAFGEQLDDSYVVFHHVGWVAHDKRKHPHDGEADFVIAHPDRSVLVIEVKGGTIRRDGKAGRWTTTSASGITDDITDPVEQAKDSKYVLLDRLKLALGRYIVMGHAVAFPDVEIRSTFLGLNLPRQLVLDATDLPQLARWVGQALAYWDARYSQQETPLGQDGLQELLSILGNQWIIRPALWRQFGEEGKQLMQLTEQQYAILDALNRHRRVIISGFAGSGKTLLAVEKAVRLSRQGLLSAVGLLQRQSGSRPQRAFDERGAPVEHARRGHVPSPMYLPGGCAWGSHSERGTRCYLLCHGAPEGAAGCCETKQRALRCHPRG